MKIREYLNYWLEKGVINEEQKRIMLHDVEVKEKKSNNSRIITAVSVMGSVILGIGFILFIASNWEYLGKNVKLLMAISLPVISLSIGYYLIHVKKDYKRIGYSLSFLGSLLIGATLTIISQVYNTSGELKDLVLIWSILSMPLLLVFRSRAILFLILVLTTWWVFLISDFNIFDFKYFPYIFSGLAIGYFIIGRLFNKYYRAIFDIFAIKIFAIASFILTFVDYHKSFIGKNDESILLAIFFNIVFIAFLGLLYYAGNKYENRTYLDFAFFWTGVYILARYFSFFWGMFNISLFFMIGGILLIVVSIFLEKRRKIMLKKLIHNVYEENR